MAVSYSTNTLVANLPQLVGILGAVLAASVGFISFWFNYRATLRNQRDTQFFEALKRFGDEHPAMRTSAAGLLAQMAETGWNRWWHDFDRRLPYFTTTLNQLAAGIALETEPVVAAAISDALKQLATLEPHRVLAAVAVFNRDAQRALLAALATYCALENETGASIEEALHRAAAASPYDESVLYALIARHSSYEKRTAGFQRSIPFATLRANAAVELELTKGSDRSELRKVALNTITAASNRLRDTANVLVVAARLARPTIRIKSRSNALGEPVKQFTVSTKDRGLYQPLDLDRTFLVDADFANKDLELIAFGTAQLDGADFSGSHLVSRPSGAPPNRANFDGALVDNEEPEAESSFEAALIGAHGHPRSYRGGFARDAAIGLLAFGLLSAVIVLYAFGTYWKAAVLIAYVGTGALYYTMRRFSGPGVIPISNIIFLFVAGIGLLGSAVVFSLPPYGPLPPGFHVLSFVPPICVTSAIFLLTCMVVGLQERGRRMRYS
jgi:hypothetical protein